ncbi:hybrid sensor histidine kinase/response regulator transcription factor [Spongiivirga citrea]|uniref:histidine kinase n=1 Tax=Spongiivirga citrea TaxID=1481457 RepID=A0A6M0CGW5_9FLAO|nr:response regulator [Spongiivirga citrea]NER17065.1 response regulator [Spongiivirga citrea]
MRYLGIAVIICGLNIQILKSQQQDKINLEPVNDGLINSWVSAITQDSLGFIWIGTQDGLHRYDGYRYQVYRNSPDDDASIAANWIKDIAIDSNGDFWLGTYGGGVCKFSARTDTFTNFAKDSINKFSSKLVSGIAAISENHILSATEDGYVQFNITKNTYKNLNIGHFQSDIAKDGSTIWLVDKSDVLIKYNLDDETLNQIYAFDERVIKLVYVPNVGLIVGMKNRLILFNNDKPTKEFDIPNDLKTIEIAQDGSILIVVKNGLYQLDIKTSTIKQLEVNIDLNQYELETIFIDESNTLWLGTNKGLFKQEKKYRAFAQNHIKLHGRRITKHKETLYVGGSQGLYRILKTPEQLIKNRRILGLYSTNDELLASSDYSYYYKINNQEIDSIQIGEKTGQKLRVLGLEIDKNKRKWIGSWSGLFLFDPDNQPLGHISIETESNLGESKITQMHLDHNDRMWIITSGYGIFRIDNASTILIDEISKHIINYRNEAGNRNSINSNLLLSLEEDENGNMWFGTEAGVANYNENNSAFDRMYYQDELLNKKIMTIRKDGQNQLWITTINDGIYVFEQSGKTITHYTKSDGLISNAFLYGSGYYDAKNNSMYLGTDEGVQIIDLSKNLKSSISKSPVITEIMVNTTNDKTLIAPAKAPYVNKLTLAANQNDFAIRFSTLNFDNPQKIRYYYTVDQKNWKLADFQTAYFTNMPYGKQTLTLKSVYDGDENTTAVTTLPIFISPPWFLSNTAKFGYILLFLGMLYGIYRYQKWRWQMKLNLNIEKQEAAHFKKLNEQKSRLYTDIAHEFKTPLTLISGPLEDQLRNNDISNKDRTNISIASRNVERLTVLVDQLLGLAKLDDGKQKLHLKSGDLGLFLHSLVESFEYQATKRQIGFVKDIQIVKQVFYDEDVIEKIVVNLLSNALKYTSNNGDCFFSAKIESNQLLIVVKNDADELNSLQLEKVFTRFYQFNDHNEGTGIGLALTKELVELCKGTINVFVEDDQKIAFKVVLPIKTNSQTTTDTTSINYSIKTNASNEFDETNTSELPILLVIEDNNELRTFIQNNFVKTYQVLEAANGKTGLEMALEYVPDVILSDIQMPLMNGMELCDTLKADERTSHIPVILLTASFNQEHELKGLSSGADDYITKPFKLAILEQRIANQVNIRKQLRARYQKGMILKPKDLALTSIDEAFLNNIKNILDSHITDSAFTAEKFCEYANVSRMQLHRKLVALTGMSTSAFIRSQRLQLATEMLKNSDQTINEIAYAIGFNTPTYFMRCFKETFGKTPSEYLETELK